MRIGRFSRLLAGSSVAILVTLGCPEPPNPVTHVNVTSAIDTILDLGRTAQLAATGLDQDEKEVSGTEFTWAANPTSVATVNAGGLATAQGVGTATVTASTQNKVPVTGSLRLRVVDANLEAVTTLAGDAFASALVGAVSGAKRGAVQAALAGCATAVSTGNVAAIKKCADGVRAEAASATDGTDRALLGVLSLYADQIERQLGL